MTPLAYEAQVCYNEGKIGHGRERWLALAADRVTFIAKGNTVMDSLYPAAQNFNSSEHKTPTRFTKHQPVWLSRSDMYPLQATFIRYNTKTAKIRVASMHGGSSTKNVAISRISPRKEVR